MADSPDTPKVARGAPAPRPVLSAADLTSKLEVVLREQFSLGLPPEFAIVVEGTTDRDYVLRSVEIVKERFSVDLLCVPAELTCSKDARIAVITPGRPNDPTRGGTPHMVRLAEVFSSYV